MYERIVELHNDDNKGRWYFRGRDSNGKILLRSSGDIGEPREGKPRGHKPRANTPSLHRVYESEVKGEF